MNRAEFERLAIEQLDACYRMAMQLTRNAEEASDLVQETYLKAIGSAERFEDRGGGVRPWLFTIMHNTFRTRIKREAKAPAAVDQFYEADGSARAPDEPPPAWDLASLDWEHVDERLKAAIDGLKPEFRMVLLLWGVEGLKYRQIAEIMDMPIGTVMSRLHRARRILMDTLENMSDASAVRTSDTHDD